MQGAKDPDEYIQKFGVKRFELLIKNASNSVEFRLNKAQSGLDMDTSDGKIEYVKKAVAILSDIPNVLEREVYVSSIAEKTGVSKDRILSQVSTFRRNKKRKAEKTQWEDIKNNKAVMQDNINPQKAKNLKEAIAEENIIAFLFRNQDYFDKIVQKIKPEDFVTEFGANVYKYMIDIKKSTGDILLGTMNEVFTQQQLNRISQILAKNNSVSYNIDMINDCINVLLKHKNTATNQDILNMSEEQFREYAMQIQAKKLQNNQ